MKNIFALLSATTMLTMGTGAFAADESAKSTSKVDYKKNGGYESTRSSEQTTSDGTAHSSENKVDVDVDSKGNIDKTVKSTSSTDPKGMMNKKKDTSETEIEEKSNGGYKQTTTRNQTDADGTDITYKTTTNVDVDDKGNVVTTATTEKTVDPKGLMNKTKTTSKTKTVNGQVVEKKSDSK